MQEQRSPNDLLEQWAREKSRTHVARTRWLISIASLLLVTAVVEQVTLGSIAVFTALVFGGLIAIGLGLALLYSAFIFAMGLLYAKFVRQKGETRPNPWHLLSMVALGSATALFLAAFTIQDTIAQPFWIVIIFAVWTNILCSCLGYLAEFLLKTRP